MLARVEFGFAVGMAAFAGVSLLRDGVYAMRRRGRLQWRVYLVESLWGGLIGAAAGFYLDAAQVSLVVDKFHRYLSAGATAEPYGRLRLPEQMGFPPAWATSAAGRGCCSAEALAGVICWSMAAWLFAVNRTFLTAYFRRETAPIKSLFTRDGLVDVSQNMLEVLRWGLWMSPIISSFLRPMGAADVVQPGRRRSHAGGDLPPRNDQPGGVSRLESPRLHLLLAYDVVRVLIWLDHMGLRVATLVNLSFLGMDKLDERLARFLGRAATAQCIPEGVKRFATWAPLLIPYYIPAGPTGISPGASTRPSNGPPRATVSWRLWWPFRRPENCCWGRLPWRPAPPRWRCCAGFARAAPPALGLVASLSNAEYSVAIGGRGEMVSRALHSDYDLSRRCYDALDPGGRALFLVDASRQPAEAGRAWPVLGNFPRRCGPAPQIERREGCLGHPPGEPRHRHQHRNLLARG